MGKYFEMDEEQAVKIHRIKAMTQDHPCCDLATKNVTIDFTGFTDEEDWMVTLWSKTPEGNEFGISFAEDEFRKLVKTIKKDVMAFNKLLDGADE